MAGYPTIYQSLQPRQKKAPDQSQQANTASAATSGFSLYRPKARLWNFSAEAEEQYKKMTTLAGSTPPSYPHQYPVSITPILLLASTPTVSSTRKQIHDEAKKEDTRDEERDEEAVNNLLVLHTSSDDLPENEESNEQQSPKKRAIEWRRNEQEGLNNLRRILGEITQTDVTRLSLSRWEIISLAANQLDKIYFQTKVQNEQQRKALLETDTEEETNNDSDTFSDDSNKPLSSILKRF